MADGHVPRKSVHFKPTLEVKRQAVEYYNGKGVPKCLENLLNTMFLEDPEDIYGYMAEFFAKQSMQPMITKVEFQEQLSNRGYQTFKGSVFCKINGIERFVNEMPNFFDDGPKVDVPKIKTKPTTGKGNKKSNAVRLSLSAGQKDALLPKRNMFDFVETQDDIRAVSKEIVGWEMGNQGDMDAEIRSYCDNIIKERIAAEANTTISESGDQQESVSKEQQETVQKEKETVPKEQQETVPKEKETVPKEQQGAIPEEQAFTTLCQDCIRKTKVNYAELYISILTAKLSSEVRHRPLYESLYKSCSNEAMIDIVLPTPMVSVMKCGIDSPGKLNMLKGIYLVPKPQSGLLEGFRKISAIYRELGVLLREKPGVNGKVVTSDGSFSPSLEKMEQVFEFLTNACIAADIDLEQDIDFILDIGASLFYDEDKKKYEVSAGSHRTSEDMIAMYSDFVERFPIIGIIDGMSHKDTDGCCHLNKQLSERCFCFGDLLFEENIDNIEDKMEDQLCNGAVLRVGNYFSNLTELAKLSSQLKDNGFGILTKLTTTQGCIFSLMPDIATAVGATFIALGALVHEESIQASNRLIEIENDLMQKDKLKKLEKYSFPAYIEEEQEENIEGDGTAEQSTS